MNISGLLIKLVHAADPTGTTGGAGSGSVTFTNPLQTESISGLISTVTNYFVFDIAPLIVVAMVLFGAFQILTAGGDSEKAKTGRKTILYAILGYAVILIAAGIVAVIQNFLGAGS
jgi:hypothetical protein